MPACVGCGPRVALAQVVTCDDRFIEGCVMETSAARETFDVAVRSGAGAYLVEQSTQSVDVFTVRGRRHATTRY